MYAYTITPANRCGRRITLLWHKRRNTIRRKCQKQKICQLAIRQTESRCSLRLSHAECVQLTSRANETFKRSRLKSKLSLWRRRNRDRWSSQVIISYVTEHFGSQNFVRLACGVLS
ncbi:MAG: hypothetical protein [Microviridae sp.]|nr:MAG: hypothetical protein [Microviridae sp.]